MGVTQLVVNQWFALWTMSRAVIKRQGPGISNGYYERGPQLLSSENRRKIEPKEIPNCLIPRLLVVFTWQLEILVTTPHEVKKSNWLLTSKAEKLKSHYGCKNPPTRQGGD